MSEINEEVTGDGTETVVAAENAQVTLLPTMTPEIVEDFIRGEILHTFPPDFAAHPINSVHGISLSGFIQAFNQLTAKADCTFSQVWNLMILNHAKTSKATRFAAIANAFICMLNKFQLPTHDDGSPETDEELNSHI